MQHPSLSSWLPQAFSAAAHGDDNIAVETRGKGAAEGRDRYIVPDEREAAAALENAGGTSRSSTWTGTSSACLLRWVRRAPPAKEKILAQVPTLPQVEAVERLGWGEISADELRKAGRLASDKRWIWVAGNWTRRPSPSSVR